MDNNKTKPSAAVTAESNASEPQPYKKRNPCTKSISQTPDESKFECSNVARERILPYIGIGSQNAISRRELIRVSGIPDRAMRFEIEALRRSGCVILSDNNGYFLPSDEHEIEAYIRREESRAKSTFLTLKAARKLRAELQVQESGQVSL